MKGGGGKLHQLESAEMSCCKRGNMIIGCQLILVEAVFPQVRADFTFYI
jgi:hypothetical protein